MYLSAIFFPGSKDACSGKLTGMVSASEPAPTNDEHILGPDEKSGMLFISFSCQ